MKVSESNPQLSLHWVQSVESEAIPGLQELGAHASDELYETWFTDTLEPYLQPYVSNTADEEEWNELTDSILRRPYYKAASFADKRRIQTALLGEPKWMYSQEYQTDGLWPETVPTCIVPANTISRFVLSGALGDALIEQDKSLSTQAERFVDGTLNQAVLLGGAAVYAFQKLYHRPVLQGFYRADDQQGSLQWETSIGGDIHGDFRVERQARPIQAIADTTSPDFQHHFMPAIHESRVGAYHSTERGIVSGLLYHLVGKAGRNQTELHDSLYRTLQDRTIHVGGNFADYGDRSGAVEAALLQRRLEEGVPGDDLYASVVGPDTSARFHMTSREDGVDLAMTDDDMIREVMHLPNPEIEQFIITMITAGGGRTAPGAMIEVIDALIHART